MTSDFQDFWYIDTNMGDPTLYWYMTPNDLKGYRLEGTSKLLAESVLRGECPAGIPVRSTGGSPLRSVRAVRTGCRIGSQVLATGGQGQ